MKKTHKTDFYHLRLLCAIALLSLSLVCYQLLLMHFLTIVQWHHFAYMVISVALLGFGASGTLIALFRKYLLQQTQILLPFLMICTGLLMPLALRLSRSDWIRFDSYLLFVESSQFVQLLLTYFLFFLPFFTGALAIGITFVKKVSDIGVFYFSDLLGAGLGGILAIIFLWILPIDQILIVLAIFSILSGLLLIPLKRRGYLLTFAFFSLLITGYQIGKPLRFFDSQFKGLSYAMNIPEAIINTERSSPYGLTQIVTAPSMRYAPGLSLNYTGDVPISYTIFNNGDWYGSILPWSRKDSIHLLDYTTMSIGYSLGIRDKVLLLRPNSGLDPGHALSKGSKSITIIEPNKIVVSLLNNEYAAITDSIFYNSALRVHSMEPRTFLARNKDSFNLIQLPLLGAFGGTVGLQALKEENLLTIEAFQQMWHKLSPDGVIQISAWLDFPYRISLKCAATLIESLESQGIKNPLSHIAAVRSWGTISFIIKKTPLNAENLKDIRAFCETFYFDPTILPGITKEELTRYNGIEDEEFFDNLNAIFTYKRNSLYDTYPYNIRPTTDNKPYFSQFLKLENAAQLRGQLGQQSASFLELGYLVVLVTFVQVAILAILFIIAPLFKLGWKGNKKLWVLLYFGGLGFGYMFLEIVLIKHFVLYLGNPIYSVATVISVMLISSGLGSFYSSRLRAQRKTLTHITLIIIFFVLLYTLLLGPLLENTIYFQLWGRVSIAVLLIALPSFFMGMPFPTGLRVVAGINQTHVAWAWGVNGCISVIAVALATILAVETGFITVLLLVAASYTMASASNILLKN